LATTEKHKIIPTILSRCQIFDFNRIQVNEIVGHLRHIADKEKIQAEEEALHLIAQKADGALRDALSLFDLLVTYSADRNIRYEKVIENLHILDYDYFLRAAAYLHEGDHTQVLLLLDEILKKGFDGHHFMLGLAEHFRSLLVCKDPKTHVLLQLSESIKEQYIAQSAQCSASFLLSCINLANECDIHYKSSKHPRLHLEVYLLKMAHVMHAFTLSSSSPPADSSVKKK
jgi:DNA polymerase-3 subunit gamma/tau